MFLKRFIFINWGNVPTIDFEFGPINLFSGGNGSGKTTAADAIQTVMTAAQGTCSSTTRDRTRRRSGDVAANVCVRWHRMCWAVTMAVTRAWIRPMATWRRSFRNKGEGQTRSPPSSRCARLARPGRQQYDGTRRCRSVFVLPGVELEQRHFVQQTAAGRQDRPTDRPADPADQRAGQAPCRALRRQKAYLRRLYGALRGKNESVSDIEAVAAGRAFSRFMAYKPVKSIDRFVADEILEQKDLGEAIRSVSSQLKTIHGMERDAAQLTKSIETLERARAMRSPTSIIGST